MQADIKVAAKQVGNKLVVSYEVTNHSSTELYLFNQLLSRNAESRLMVDPNKLLVDVEGGVVLLKKETPQPPEGQMVFQLPVDAYITVVEGNGIFKETFEVALPLTPWSPYRRAPKAPLQKAKAKGVTLRVECLRPSSQTVLGQKDLDAGPVLFLKSAGSEDVSGYLTSELIPLEFSIEF